MHHLDIRIGRERYLLCDPQTTPTGRATGYGNLVRHIEQTLRAGMSLRATVFLIKPRRPLNPALYDLDSDQVRIVGHADWRAPALRLLWHVSTPVRHGKPVQWLESTLAFQLRPLVEWAKQRSRARGWRAVDRWLDRVGHQCRRISHGYEEHIVSAWSALYREARDQARAAGSKHPLRIHLRSGTERATAALAREAGIDPARPIVTLHVRESGFRTRGAERQRDVDTVREASIEHYAAAVSSLVARGYQVVRLGDPSMTPCPWPGVIDLAIAPWRTGAFEIWALLRSRFFIASDSGPYFLCKLCDVPCLSVNVVQLGYYAAGERDRYICKLVWDRTIERRLSIAEMLTEEFMSTGLDCQRYEWIENQPDDIREAVEDQIALLDAPATPRTPAQQRHDAVLAAVVPRLRRSTRSRMSLLFRVRSRGTISPGFAARYME